MTLPERVESRISPEPNTGCWLWTGSWDQLGYGMSSLGGRTVRAHRVVYELLRGSIGEGLELDHLCRQRCCVNPDHLEAVSHRVNSLRGVSPLARNARKTECKNGHPLSGDNIMWCGGRRRCRLCARDYHRAYMRVRRSVA